MGWPGGTATAFSNVAGNPQVNFTQVHDALFVQDDWNVGHGVHIAAGLRYFVQNDPATFSGLVPRAGVLWSPTKDGKWTLHAHAGLFNGRYGQDDAAEVLRMDGVQRITSTVYNPAYGDPVAGATAIHSVRQFAPGVSNVNFAIENIGRDADAAAWMESICRLLRWADLERCADGECELAAKWSADGA